MWWAVQDSNLWPPACKQAAVQNPISPVLRHEYGRKTTYTFCQAGGRNLTTQVLACLIIPWLPQS